MLENKKLNMVISLLIAIALWAFVIGEINPQATRVYRDVPVKLIHQEVLDESGLAVLSVSENLLNVTLTGTRSEINKIDAKDISATVDLQSSYLGENQLPVDIRVSGKADVEEQSVEKVTVIVEEWLSKEVSVEVSYEGSFNGEEEPITIEQELDSVTVSGAETTVEAVVVANAIVREGTVTADAQEVQCDLIAINKNGQRIYNVELSANSILVTSELAKLKTVPLEVSLEGEDSEDIKRAVKVPEKITLKGRTSDLEDIESIETETIYLDSILTSTTVPIIPILPEGVTTAKESETLTASIQVTEIQTTSFNIDKEDVVFHNLQEGLEAVIDIGTIKVEVTGSKAAIDDITKEDVTVSMDLAELQQGKHKIDLNAECAVEGVAVTVLPKKASVTLSKGEPESDSETVAEEDSEPEEQENNNDNQSENSEE